jgi:hypothetical protein
MGGQSITSASNSVELGIDVVVTVAVAQAQKLPGDLAPARMERRALGFNKQAVSP